MHPLEACPPWGWYLAATNELNLIVFYQGVPNKGPLLTLLTVHWFKVLTNALPELRTHFLTLDLASLHVSETLRGKLRNRSMQVRKLQVFPIEAIVRGYITGSAWKEYQKMGTVHGIRVRGPPRAQ